MLKKIGLILLLLVASFCTKASHIVGGEYTYTYIGNNNYRIIFYLYRDCVNGNPGALTGDNPASIRVFNRDNLFGPIVGDSSGSNLELIVPTGFSNSCLINPPPVCLNRLRFEFTINLQPNANGYLIAYQRCCRNEVVTNILNAQGNQVGATYFCEINTQFGPNNSAIFKNYPPQILCINTPLTYDNSATDSNGDSLSYELCEAKDIENNIINPNYSEITPPDYPNVPYSSGFTFANPMLGNPTITIDPVTGIFSGTPNIQGRYVVTVCCTEWRNGIAINVNRRDFQFEVTNCSKAVVAKMPLLSLEPNTYIVQCKGLSVKFLNTSSGGFNYHWDFGVTTSATDTSNLFQPTFTYPDTGTYIVKLVVNRGSTCADSIEHKVKVYPTYNTDFNLAGINCPNENFTFTDLSNGTLAPPSIWKWNFGDDNVSNIANPMHVYGKSGTFPVQLISQNTFGCRDTATKFIIIPFYKIKTANDTIVVVNTAMQLYVTGAQTYKWYPNTFMDDDTKAQPNFFFPNTGTFKYMVVGLSQDGCIDTAYLKVTVVKEIQFFMPNAFSPNGDNTNDDFKVISAGYSKLNAFRIYNRWGEQVFYTNRFLTGWDGFHKDKPAEPGVYYWYAELVDIAGKTVRKKGDVTLVR